MTTETRPHLYVTYFEAPLHHIRYRPLLERWLQCLSATGMSLPMSVLTDPQTDPEAFSGCFYVPVDPSPFADCMRPGNHFDRKSAIIASALLEIPPEQPAMVFDCDALIRRDFSSALAEYLRLPCAVTTPPDSGKRMIRARNGHMIPERSSSVLLFGPSTADERKQIAHDFRASWHYLAQTEPDAGLATTIREQRAWSLVHHLWGAVNLPDVWNWSPYHWKPNPDAYVIHYHGQRKFADVPKAP